MKLLKLQAIMISLFVVLLSSCDLADKAAIQYLECQGYNIDCIEENDPQVDPNNNYDFYFAQAVDCGGAADVFGMFDFANNSALYTDTAGMTVFYHRFVFFDADGNQMFTTKYADYTQLPEGTEAFIVPYSDPNRVKYYRIRVMEIVDTSDPNVNIYLCHQFRECPGIEGDNCNFAANIYPSTPVKLIGCDGDFGVGQDLGLVTQIPMA